MSTLLTVLERVVEAHKYLYYYMGSSLVSDQDFDLLFKALPDDSPIKCVGINAESVHSLTVWGCTTHEGRNAIMQATRKLLEELRKDVTCK